ncbi:hypothetical protein BVRB_4g088240 [Beta vulgaris subsp. vulgaris]|nr:hypothetical protein BVRB_4g088240 [Beta vulgaris subsp. vulgaris]
MSSRGVAVYTDNEGHQTLQSMSSNNYSVPRNLSRSNGNIAQWFPNSCSRFSFQDMNFTI